jgi:catechol 2,3-dioxygenase-like lactoylglutathione lyase family enzyme
MTLSIDHLVLTVRSVERSLAFYERALGMRREISAGRPAAITFGAQKINLHQMERPFEPKAANPTPGSADFCLITDRPLDEISHSIEAAGASIELGPVARTGARGPMTSIYFRDPDGNLVEVSRYPD